MAIDSPGTEDDTATDSTLPQEKPLIEKPLIEVSDSARATLSALAGRKWSFTVGTGSVPPHPSGDKFLGPDARTYWLSRFSQAAMYESCRAKWKAGSRPDLDCSNLDLDDWIDRLWILVSTDGQFFSKIHLVTNQTYWSRTQAVTPGGHHVRLYLETEGRITTLLSKKDNFVEFYSGEAGSDGRRACLPPSSLEGVGPGNSEECSTDIAPVTFLAPDASRLASIRPRDPNVTMNDAGVYVMTWDNRPATDDYYSTCPVWPAQVTVPASRTFGLAFSVDGLNWTVVSNDLTLQGIPVVYDTKPNTRYSQLTGKLRHVVPVFITNEQLRIYFTAEAVSRCQGNCPGIDTDLTSCSTATAISN
ncbi:MAG: hypothetical protein HYT87_18615 [Nitrospirae bacterium]|nr:hypothetical protein [Nitrospirota bacterium]